MAGFDLSDMPLEMYDVALQAGLDDDGDGGYLYGDGNGDVS